MSLIEFPPAVEKVYPGDRDRLARMSLIEGLVLISSLYSTFITYFPEGMPKQFRMASLAVIGSRKVNGVAEVTRLLSLSKFVLTWICCIVNSYEPQFSRTWSSSKVSASEDQFLGNP